MIREPLSILVFNQKWFVEELRALGHRVVTVGGTDWDCDIVAKKVPISLPEILKNLPRGFYPDRLIYFDDSRPFHSTGFEEVEFPTLFYSVDSHHHVWWHKHLAKVFDKTLVAQRRYVADFENFGCDVSWFPVWATKIFEPANVKTIPISFRGTLDEKLHPDRKAFFSRLAKYFEVDVASGPYEEVYAHSQIVMNEAVKDDLNFRVFEAMMGGALLITPHDSTGLTELFEPGGELVTYERGNEKDAAEKIRYYLDRPEEREKIAKRGREKVLLKHTNMERARALEKHLSELSCTSREDKYSQLAVTYLATSKSCRSNSPSLGRKFLNIAVQCFFESLKNDLTRNDNFELHVMYCKQMLEDDAQSTDAATKFLHQLYQASAGNTFFAVALIDDLLTKQRREEALEVATAVSADPQQLVSKAPEIIGNLMQTVFGIEGRSPRV